MPIPTPVPFTRIISVPALEIETVPEAGLNKPVVASPLRCGFVADVEVPRATWAAVGDVINTNTAMKRSCLI